MTDMNDSRTLMLLSTEHCTLCEQALDLLLSMPELNGTTLNVVDVARHETLLERYGPRVPVLCFGGRELDWPFDGSSVVDLVTSR